MPEFALRFLLLDLNESKYSDYFLNAHEVKSYIGGLGVSTYLLNKLLLPNISPLDPQNLLIFSVGTLVGTSFPTASRTEVSALSPLTKRLGTSNSGMNFGKELKASGYDGLIIKGAAREPVYLSIIDGEVKINDAHSLWGKDTFAAVSSLEQEYPGTEKALIGIAGENKVYYASLQNGCYDAWARTGLGAVMGSKRLKAIVVKGNKKSKAIHPEKFRNNVKEANKRIKESPFYLPFKKYGTMNASIVYNKFKALPGHNFTQSSFNEWNDKYGKHIVDYYVTKNIACHACSIACGHWVEIDEGSYKGLQIKDLEITPFITFGAQCGLEPEAAIKASEISQKLGMDMVSLGSTIAMTIELFKQDYLTSSEVGYKLDWGDADAIFQLMYDIAYQKGIGKLLSKGTKELSYHFDYEEGAIQIKGLELPMIDPRGRWSTWTLGMLTNPRGGDHLRCRNPLENLRYNETTSDLMWEKYGLGEKEYEKFDMPLKLKEQAFDLTNDMVNIPLMSKWAEDLITIYNSLGICIRPPVLNTIGPTILADSISSYTGIDISANELIKAGERCFNLIKIFNLKHGEQKWESAFPSRFFKGVNHLSKDKVNEVLRCYYKYRGWEEQEGVPSLEKLEELGLREV